MNKRLTLLACFLAVAGCEFVNLPDWPGGATPTPTPVVADAGEDVTVFTDEPVTLTATATGGVEPYVFRWTIESLPDTSTLGLPDADTNAVLELDPLTVAGRYVFRVRVTDSAAQVDMSFVAVTAEAPLDVTATTDHSLRVVGETAQLTTTLNVNTTGLDDFTYNWEVVSGEADISDATIADPEVAIRSAETVQLRVTVSGPLDGEDRSGRADVYIVGVDTALPRVQIENSGGVTGDIVLELLTEAAPNTCANFLRYVDDQFYDGIVWHRVVSDFVIQGGAYERQDGDLVQREGARDPVASEANNGESNVRGTVAMALTQKTTDSDTIEYDADSATNQFFVNLADNVDLDTSGPFTVFARVVEGQDVVDQIAAVQVGTDAGSGLQNVPVEDIVMTSVHRVPGALTVTATSAKPLVINGQTTELSTTLSDSTVAATAAYAWEVVSGRAALSDATIADPTVTINTNGTVHLQVTVTDQQEDGPRTATGDVYIVGVENATPRVYIENSGGVAGYVVLELLTEDAPQTCANFLRYVDDQFYDGIVWHRVVADFVIQGGAYERVDGELVVRSGVRDPVPSEANNGHSNVRGTVAMALSGEDADSGTNQFFINLGDNSASLDDGPPPFTVFATVVSGMNVVDQIGAVEVIDDETARLQDVPAEDITMTHVRRVSSDE